MKPLSDQVALVAGATRGCGRAIALELAAAGAHVYVTGRSSRSVPGSGTYAGRPETIEETAERIARRGGSATAVRVDHECEDEVRALIERIAAERDGRLDILVNDIWGGERLMQWGVPLWESDLEKGFTMLRRAIRTHLITARHALPLMVARRSGLVVEITDGDTDSWRGELFYDLAKNGVNRIAHDLAQELAARDLPITAVALTPGFLRSEMMLDHFGVTEANWRGGVAKDPFFAFSETPHYVARALVALAADPGRHEKAGKALSSWGLSEEYDFVDLDGRRPHWGRDFAAAQSASR